MDRYSLMVSKLAKSGQEILDTLDASKANAIHMSLGIAGESGELVDEIKKYVAYNRESDREKVIKEMGDLEFYLEGLRQGLDITRDEVLDANMSKLSERYGEDFEYSDQKANDRVDVKVELLNDVEIHANGNFTIDEIKEYFKDIGITYSSFDFNLDEFVWIIKDCKNVDESKLNSGYVVIPF